MRAPRHCRSPSRAAMPRRLGGLLASLLAPAALLAAEAATPPDIDAAGVAAWADQAFTAALSRHEFSGATVSVVRDGAPVFSRGYGRADFSRPATVDPQATQFRIGSITKTFTATIIAQLVDEGRIASLDDPANKYLRDYRLPDNGGVPISLSHLLTHTAGFEDQFFFIGTDTPVPTHPTAELFDSLRPAYEWPAGSRVEYSNFGIAVLGRIVEDITGMGIAQAMRQRIFTPLGMSHTRLLDDIREPATLGRPATILADGSYRPTPFTAINPPFAAAGSIATTADDMARHMLAQLGNAADPATGPLPGFNRRVLDLLHTRRAGNAADTTGLGMVFFIDDWGGLRTISHGGNWEGFHSWMTLIPSRNAGIFVSLMSERPPATSADDLRKLFAPWVKPAQSPAVVSGAGYTKDFLRHFLGERRALPAAAAATDTSNAASLGGWYRFDRRPFTTAEAVGDLFYLGAGVIRVAATPDGLEIAGAGPWRPAGGGAFMLDSPNRDRTVIRRNAETGIPVLVPDLGIYTASRIGWYQHPLLHVYVVLAALLAACAGLVMLHGARAAGVSRTARLFAWSVVLAAAALLPIALWGRSKGAGMLVDLYAGHRGRMIAFVVTAHALLLAALCTTFLASRSRAATRARRALFAIGVCGLAISAILAVYNVLGWHIPG